MNFWFSKKCSCLLLFLFLSGSIHLYAASYSWTGGAGTATWNDALNWGGSGYPVDGDNVTINKSGSPISISVPNTITTLANLTTNNITLVLNSSITVTGTVSITSTVFSPTGTLSVANSSAVTITGSTFNVDLTVVNTSSSLISFNSTAFNEDFDLTGNNISLISNTFSSVTTILKKGSSQVLGAACRDNTYNGVTRVYHEESGLFYFGGNNDVFNAAALFENKSGAQQMRIGETSVYTSPVYFHGNTEFINHSNSEFHISASSTSHVKFSPLTGVDSIQVRMKNWGTNYFYIAYNGGIDLEKTKVHMSSSYAPTSGTPYAGSIQLGAGLGSPTANRITFDANSNLYSDSVTVSSSLNGLIFEGQYTPGVTDTPDTLRFNGTHYIFSIGTYCRFDRHVKVDVPNLSGLGGVYNGKTNVINRGQGGSVPGYATFNNDVSFVYKYPSTGEGWGLYGHTGSYASFNNPSSGQSVVTLRSESPSPLWFGYLSASTLDFNGVKVVLERASTGFFYLGYLAGMQLNDVDLVIKNNTSGQLILGNGGRITLDGVTLDVKDVLQGMVTFDNVRFVEDVSIECITAGNSATFNIAAKSVFEKDLFLKAANFSLTGGLFKGNVELYKYQTTGSAHQYFSGNATFQKDVVMINNTDKLFTHGNNAAHTYIFRGNVTLKRLSTGELRLCDAGTCNFRGNLDYQGNVGSLPFGNTGGVCVFDSTLNQTISHNSTTGPLLFVKLEVKKDSGKLTLVDDVSLIPFAPYGVSGSLILRKGNIVTSASPNGLLALADNIPVSGGGRHSYVEGPLKKEGNDAFKFHIGKGMKYFPVSMTSPSTTGAAFTAEFFPQNIPVADTKTGTLKDLLKCQYWKIDKAGTSNPVSITLSWYNETGQNCGPVDADVVTVARFNSPNWQSEGANNLVSSPGDSGTVQSNALSSMGYIALGATLANTITPNEVYAVLKPKIDGSYYSVIENKLYFKFEEEYTASGSLNYQVYDEQRNQVSLSTLVVQYGDNRYGLNTMGLTSGKYYILEVSNSKKEKLQLRFKA